jgi:general secretion pathway protein E
MEYLTKFLKQLGDLDINEKRKPQTSKFSTKKDNIKTEFQIITAGSTAGEKIVIIKMQEGSVKTIDQIGLTKTQIENFKNIFEEQKGIFLVTGPSGAGVSTTLYALIKNHDPFMNNINVLEKKKSLELHNVTQNYYRLSDTGTGTYGKRLLTMTRTGPDIIAVADVEDADTAKVLANYISSDPKITYATFSAPSVIQAVAKWFKMVPDRNLAVDVLTGISCQRLVRTLCKECRQAYEPKVEIFKKFNIPADKIKILYRQGQIEYDKNGKPIVCPECQGTGFVGRTGVFETIFFTPELRDAIKKAKSLQEISTYFRKARMLFLQEQAIRKVAEGITSIDEVIREFSPKTPDAAKRASDANKK